MKDAFADVPQTLTDEAILQRFAASTNMPPASATLGFRLKSVCQAERRVEVEFDARAERVANPMGQIQGGMICAMLDEAMSVAVGVASGMTCVAPTLEMKTSFLRPAMPGLLLAVGTVIKWGRTIAFTEGELYDADGRLVAKASGTVLPTPFSKFKQASGA